MEERKDLKEQRPLEEEKPSEEQTWKNPFVGRSAIGGLE